LLDFDSFEVLTFDCYGTLIDWETGILNCLRGVLEDAGKQPSDNEILSIYAEIEARLEADEYRSYKDTLRRVMESFGEHLDFEPSPRQRESLVTSIPGWPPFHDTAASLKALKRKYKLAVISNTDDDLFEQTAKCLEVPFDWIITAEQVGSYKPSSKNFKYAIQQIGIPKNNILHIAQSIYHDIIPASSIGLATVWVNRRKGLEGFGATKPAQGKPDLEVPDLATLVSMLNI
jgi:2-haloacid dehalogenase